MKKNKVGTVARSLFLSLLAHGFTVTQDNEEDGESEVTGTDDIVVDTFRGNVKWVTTVKKDEVEVSSSQLRDIVTSLYGEPTRIHYLPDGEVYNWTLPINNKHHVLVVVGTGGVHLFKHSSK